VEQILEKSESKVGSDLGHPNLRNEMRDFSVETRYATSAGDYKMADYLKAKWADYLDDAWFINYDIMHQYPIESEARVATRIFLKLNSKSEHER